MKYYGKRYYPIEDSKVGSRAQHTSSGYSPKHTTYGLTPGKVLTKGGRSIETFGKFKQVESLTAIHPIAKLEWTQYSKKELRKQKRGTGNTRITKPVSQYDARPTRLTGAQKRHYERMPRKGIYSKPRAGNVKLYRARKFGTATGVRFSGTAIKGLGYAYYGYLAVETGKQLLRGEIEGVLQTGLNTALTFGMGTYGPPHSKPAQAANAMVEQKSKTWIDIYMQKWNPNKGGN